MMKKYSRGGPMKRPMPTPADRAASKAQNAMLKKVTPTKSEAKTLDSAARVGRQAGAEMRKMGMKKGGMAKKRYADGGMAGAGLELEAMARRGEMERELGRMDFSTPKVEAPDKKPAARTNKPAARTNKPAASTNKPAARTNKPAEPSTYEAPEITVTGKRNPPPTAKKGSDAVSRTGVGRAINRGVGAVNDQMSTQARNMAARREKNPDIFTRIFNAFSERRKDKADTATAKNAARRDFDNKAGKAGIGIMLERPPRSVKYAKGGSVTRGDGIARKGKTKGRII